MFVTAPGEPPPPTNPPEVAGGAMIGGAFVIGARDGGRRDRRARRACTDGLVDDRDPATCRTGGLATGVATGRA